MSPVPSKNPPPTTQAITCTTQRPRVLSRFFSTSRSSTSKLSVQNKNCPSTPLRSSNPLLTVNFPPNNECQGLSSPVLPATSRYATPCVYPSLRSFGTCSRKRHQGDPSLTTPSPATGEYRTNLLESCETLCFRQGRTDEEPGHH